MVKSFLQYSLNKSLEQLHNESVDEHLITILINNNIIDRSSDLLSLGFKRSYNSDWTNQEGE